MSYDVSIGSDSFNYTYNVSSLFCDHMEGGLRSLNGLTGRQACEVIAGAFDALHDKKMRLWRHDDVGEPRFCAEYDSKNGWGSAVGGILFLAQIFAACHRNPRKIVRVS